MKKTLSLFAAPAAALLITPAQAQMRAHAGYFGAGAMSVTTDNATDFAAAFIGPGGSADDSASTAKVYGGYVFPSRFGIEAGYYDLGSYDVRTGGVKSDEFKVNAFAVSGTYTLPFGGSFDANFKLGLAFTNVDYTCVTGCGGFFVNTSKSGVAGLLGAGVGWNASRNFGLRADLEIFSGVQHKVGTLPDATFDYTALSVSAQVKF